MTAFLSIVLLAAGGIAAPSALPALAAPAQCSDAPVLVSEDPGVIQASTCTADCGPFTDVSCSGSSCNAVNRSCPGEQGHVTCDGTTYYCPSCTAECTDGQYRLLIVGPTCGCNDYTGTERELDKCIDGHWVYQSTHCGPPFCPQYP